MIIKSSVIDKFRTMLDPQVWMTPKRDRPPMIKPEVRMVLMDEFMEELAMAGFLTPESWAHFYLVGSDATYQWTPNSDIDVTVVVDVESFAKTEGTSDDKAILDKMRPVWQKLNGKKLEGTNHPVNYYVTTDHNLESDAVYDLDSSIWVVTPPQIAQHYEPKVFWQDVWEQAEQIAKRWDIKGGMLHRDLTDLTRLKDDMEGLTDGDLNQVKLKVIAKEGEILARILDLVDEYDQVHDLRRSVFSMPDDMTMEQVYAFSKSWLPANVMYKVLERYGYIQILAEIKKIEHTRGLGGDDTLNEIGDMLRWKVKDAANYNTTDDLPDIPDVPEGITEWVRDNWDKYGDANIEQAMIDHLPKPLGDMYDKKFIWLPFPIIERIYKYIKIYNNLGDAHQPVDNAYMARSEVMAWLGQILPRALRIIKNGIILERLWVGFRMADDGDEFADYVTQWHRDGPFASTMPLVDAAMGSDDLRQQIVAFSQALQVVHGRGLISNLFVGSDVGSFQAHDGDPMIEDKLNYLSGVGCPRCGSQTESYDKSIYTLSPSDPDTQVVTTQEWHKCPRCGWNGPRGEATSDQFARDVDREVDKVDPKWRERNAQQDKGESKNIWVEQADGSLKNLETGEVIPGGPGRPTGPPPDQRDQTIKPEIVDRRRRYTPYIGSDTQEVVGRYIGLLQPLANEYQMTIHDHTMADDDKLIRLLDIRDRYNDIRQEVTQLSSELVLRNQRAHNRHTTDPVIEANRATYRRLSGDLGYSLPKSIEALQGGGGRTGYYPISRGEIYDGVRSTVDQDMIDQLSSGFDDFSGKLQDVKSKATYDNQAEIRQQLSQLEDDWHIMFDDLLKRSRTMGRITDTSDPKREEMYGLVHQIAGLLATISKGIKTIDNGLPWGPSRPTTKAGRERIRQIYEEYRRKQKERGAKLSIASDKLNLTNVGEMYDTDRRGEENPQLVDEIYYKLINEGNGIWSEEKLAQVAESTRQYWEELYDAETYEQRIIAIDGLIRAIIHTPLAERVLGVIDDVEKRHWNMIINSPANQRMRKPIPKMGDWERIVGGPI